jgi:hypothetical protein
MSRGSVGIQWLMIWLPYALTTTHDYGHPAAPAQRLGLV